MKFSTFIELVLILSVFCLIILTGCGGNNGTSTPYGSPVSPLVSPVYNSPLPSPEVKHFEINEPLLFGATEITGSGPPNIPLHVVDVTAGGQVLGQGIINSDGHFSIKLGEPLGERRIIGIQLATAKDPDTWTDLWSMRGDGARAIPQIGDFFDSVITLSN